MQVRTEITAAVDASCARVLSACTREGIELPANASARLAKIAWVSDFAMDVFERRPRVLQRLLADDGAVEFEFEGVGLTDTTDIQTDLRRLRQNESVRLIWRDVFALDDTVVTLRSSTRLAERCMTIALTHLESAMATRHGLVRNTAGDVVRLVIFGLGKLGGGELNFSSDIDIVFAYEEEGESDGARPLPAEQYFARLGQQFAKLLDEITPEGFSHRVDLRLRPYGNAGRVAWSFGALEQYFQREGRDWERYAWLKARAVAGDLEAGARFAQVLRPFVYRRYLDYGAIDGLREMKAMINAEVARKDMAHDVKRGPGGIREVEFFAQVLQIIRGGRTPALQCRGFMRALAALKVSGLVAPADATDLLEAYLFLRKVENRIQMRGDVQVHTLPEDALGLYRLAIGLGYADAEDFKRALAYQRSVISTHFSSLLGTRKKKDNVDDVAAYWRALPEEGESSLLHEIGFEDADAADDALRRFAQSLAVKSASPQSRKRLDRVMPALIAATAAATAPDIALARMLTLLANIMRRSSYLALLDEQPAALQRLVDILGRSALLGERLANFPILLDELLDARDADAFPTRAELIQQCRAQVAPYLEDVERALAELNELRQMLSFRIALATLDHRLTAAHASQSLAWIADAVLEAVVAIAKQDMRRAHGDVAGGEFLIVGYGSVGGEELAFGSDLDLVFLYTADADAQSEGARPLEASRWYARIAQKIVSMLQTPTAAGRLYDVDVRLRPDGAKGLLVSTLSSYADYQTQRAWTWEHQALVRARALVGDRALKSRFEATRIEILQQDKDAAKILQEIADMRARMRQELDRSRATMFDLKQGEGGLVDIEFILQALVLTHAASHPALLAQTRSTDLIAAVAHAGLLQSCGAHLSVAHDILATLALQCMLDRRKRMVTEDDTLQSARETVQGVWAQVFTSTHSSAG